MPTTATLDLPTNMSGGGANPFTQAFWRQLGCRGISSSNSKGSNEVLGQRVTQVRGLTPRQQNRRLRAAQQASVASLECSHSLTAGAAAFVVASTPTVGDLVDYLQRIPGSHSSMSCQENSATPNPISFACVNTAACAAVYQEYVAMEANSVYGRISCENQTMLSGSCTRTFPAFASLSRESYATNRSDT
jgi:hypothetical protein